MPDHEQQFDPVDARQFLSSLRKSRVVAAEKIDTFLAAYRANPEARSDRSDIAEKMIDAGLITHWQSGKLARGIHKGYFLGKYRLLDHLGTGGMSTVYLAEHLLSGQKRAIKVLPREKMAERSYLSRFYLEGRAVAALNHPNIVRIYDIAQDGERHYMVMEFIEGSDLYDVVAALGPLDFDVAADCLIQAARGLAHAHDRNLIHRDIKPANLFRTLDGAIKVLDLGLALLKSDDDPQLSQQHNERTMGTADFLSPEQALDSHDVDPRADIYSLGCTLFYLLTGRAPFNTGSLAQRIAMHQTKQPPQIRRLRSDCPEYLAAICGRMMQKNPAERFQSCGEIIAALETKSSSTTTCISQTTDQSASPAAVVSDSANRVPTDRPAKPVGLSAGRRVPIGMWVGLVVLTVAPIILAVMALNQPATQLAGPVLNTGSPTSRRETSPTAENGTTTTLPNEEIGSSFAVIEEPACPAINPSATNFRLFLDFETPSQFPENRDSWRMIENGVFVGTLLTKKKCRIVGNQAPNETQAGGFSLLLAGDSKQVEFRPGNRASKIAEVRFLARRLAATAPFTFDVDAKSNRQFDRWESIFSAGGQLDGQTYVEVVLGPEQFEAHEAHKFRFRTGGTEKDSLLIDNLTIVLD